MPDLAFHCIVNRRFEYGGALVEGVVVTCDHSSISCSAIKDGRRQESNRSQCGPLGDIRQKFRHLFFQFFVVYEASSPSVGL